MSSSTSLPCLVHSSPPPAFSQRRSQTSNPNVQERIQAPFANQQLIKLIPNHRNTSPTSAHIRDEVFMRPERTESVVQASVEYQACDDARQKGVPLCLRSGPSVRHVERHLLVVLKKLEGMGVCFCHAFPFVGGICAMANDEVWYTVQSLVSTTVFTTHLNMLKHSSLSNMTFTNARTRLIAECVTQATSHTFTNNNKE